MARKKGSPRSILQSAMRSILPAEKHITVLLELSGPIGQSPEYDRMTAIVSATFLEYGLKKAIKSHLKPDEDDPDFSYLFIADDAPYRDFASLNRLARALAIITRADYEQLETIRHIRNVFAHGMDHSLTFDSPEIAPAFDTLLIPDTEWVENITSIFAEKHTLLGMTMGRRRVLIYAVFSYYWKLILYNRSLDFKDVAELAPFASSIDK